MLPHLRGSYRAICLALFVANVPLLLPAGESGSAPDKQCAPLAAADWDYAKARHLLSRAGFGGPPEEIERLQAMGLEGAVRYLVEFQELPEVAFDPPPEVSRPPSPAELQELNEEQRRQLRRRYMQQQRAHMLDVRAWWVRRMVESSRPLEEKMVLFWHGHFTSGARTVRDSQAMFDQNQLFRRYAAGNFRRLLHSVVHDPAMLRYLDNNNNSRQHPNENLARELMELFSLGEGNYTEQDVQEAARALTGYHVDRMAGRFRFASRAHDPGDKTIFGKTSSFDGDQLVELILEQPASARWLAHKLFVFFVHDSPDEATIDHLAAVLRQHDYEIAPMLKTMFGMAEFYSPRSMGQQIKSPAQLTIGSLRALGIEKVDGRAVAAAMGSMGQELFEPPNVKGWDGGRAWINSNWLVARHRFAAGLVAAVAEEPARAKPRDRVKKRDRGGEAAGAPAARFDAVAWCQQHKAFSPEAVVDQLASALLTVPLTSEERAEFVKKLGDLPPSSEWGEANEQVQKQVANLLLLMMTMPAYQLT